MTIRLGAMGALFLALLGMMAGCGGRKAYPDSQPGWHNDDYTTIFGRLSRRSGEHADAPIWVLRYDFANAADPYVGRVALTPAEKLIGYSGGELVEVHGKVLAKSDADPLGYYQFQVQSIRIWKPVVKHGGGVGDQGFFRAR
jgi:hypothetical protein